MEFSWSLYDIWQTMSVITKLTVLVMGWMLVCTLYNLLLHFARAWTSHTAANEALRLLRNRAPLSEIIAAVRRKHDLSSSIAAAGLNAFQTAPAGFSNAEVTRSAELAMGIQERTAHLEARRCLIPLDTVANVAPLTGMFATVFGVLNAFHGPGVRGLADGFAFSLVPMIMGLVTAISALLICGFVARRIEQLDAQHSKLMLGVVSAKKTSGRRHPLWCTRDRSESESAPSRYAIGAVRPVDVVAAVCNSHRDRDCGGNLLAFQSLRTAMKRDFSDRKVSRLGARLYRAPRSK